MSGLPVALQVIFQGVGQQVLIDGCEVTSDHFVVVDVDVGEHALVQVTADRVIGLAVDRVRVSKERASGRQVMFEAIGCGAGLGQRAFCGRPLGRDPRLLALHLAHVQNIGVDGIEEALLLGVEICKLLAGRETFLGLRGKDSVDVLIHEGANFGHSRLTQGDCGPVTLDELGDDVSLGCSEAAPVLHPLAAKAVEVVVVHAL